MSSTRRRERRKGGDGPAARGPGRFVEAVREAVGGRWRGREYVPCCILCGSPRVAFGGIWSPSPAVQPKLLIPSDQFRLVGYCLCEECYRLPGAGTRVEDAILADFAELAASPLRN